MRTNRSLMASIISVRCPRCREGKMYSHKLYSAKFMEMRAACPCCGQSFILEPGFFLGAAFFSYFINAVLVIGVAFILFYTAKETSVGLMITIILIVLFGLLPATLRLSKSAWIHLFIRYEGPCSEIPRK